MPVPGSQFLTSNDQIYLKETFSRQTSIHRNDILQLNTAISRARQNRQLLSINIKEEFKKISEKCQKNSLLLLELAEKIPSIQASKLPKLTSEQKKSHSIVLNRLGYYEQIFLEEAKKLNKLK